MVTEDYVSFESAKLLKKKGFDGECDLFGRTDETELIIREASKIAYNQGIDDECIILPTLQMAMKWLREVHRIDIEVRTHYLNYLKPNDIRYYSGKILKGSEDIIHTIYSKDTYEEVCEDAIKYCLENLI